MRSYQSGLDINTGARLNKLNKICSTFLFLLLSFGTAFGQAQEFFVSAINTGEIYRSPIENPSATMVRDFVSTTTATALAVHSTNRQLFVFDIESGGGAIRRYNFDGTNETLILSVISNPQAIAIDQVNDKIYFARTASPALIER